MKITLAFTRKKVIKKTKLLINYLFTYRQTIHKCNNNGKWTGDLPFCGKY